MTPSHIKLISKSFRRLRPAHPANTRLEGQWRFTEVLPTIFPTHMFSLAPDYLFYLSLRPKSVGEVYVRFGIALPPEVLDASEDRETATAKCIDMFERLNAEDQFIVEGIYQGLGAEPLARPDRSTGSSTDFTSSQGIWLANSLASRVAGGP